MGAVVLCMDTRLLSVEPPSTATSDTENLKVCSVREAVLMGYQKSLEYSLTVKLPEESMFVIAL